MAQLFVEALSVIDFSYLHPERGVVGESWIVDLTLDGDLNEEGMVFDFGHVKKVIKAEIDRDMDHTFVVPTRLPGLAITGHDNETRIQFERPEVGIMLDYQAPAEAVTLLNAGRLSTEVAVKQIRQRLRAALPANVRGIGIELRTESHNEAFYHYSHGLKRHDGDCQRMIHGHRSRIQVETETGRWRHQERAIADQWQDIYLVTEEDIVGTRDWSGVPCYDMAYDAAQGHFRLTLPQARCDVLPTDTTVELIAGHLAGLCQSRSDKPGTVRAYEGVNKGAVAAWPA